MTPQEAIEDIMHCFPEQSELFIKKLRENGYALTPVPLARPTELWGYYDTWSDDGVRLDAIDFDPPSGQDWKVVRATTGGLEHDMSYETFYDRFVPLYTEVRNP